MNTATTNVRLAVPLGAAVSALNEVDRARLFRRGRAFDAQVASQVAQIIEAVRVRGDAALHELAQRFDGVTLPALEVPSEDCERALKTLDPALRDALEQSADALAAFHRAQLPQPLEIEIRPGVKLGRRTEPLRSVGVYAPGGRASYPSSVLMGVVPARVAGVHEVTVTSPPGPDGRPSAVLLAACALAGADRVFALGGAGAIAALALGTETVPRVDKVVGPGNAYVTDAKRQLNGEVAIDVPAGPSELLILADDTADPELVALELMAQAEHDPDASCVLVCTRVELVHATAQALERQLARAPRRTIIEAALSGQSALLHARDDAELLAFAEAYAPEHLLLLTSNPRALLDRVRGAGSVFLGAGSSVAFGDYLSGANHVLPTGGMARTRAGLSVSDFLREFTYQEITGSAPAKLAGPTGLLADAEGLPAHASAARFRAGRVWPSATGPVLRPSYQRVELYDPQRLPVDIDLSDNTNLFGVAPAVERTLAALSSARITRYPTVFADELKEAIAEWYGVGPENVVTGCGSDDVIDSALRAFCERGDRVVYPEPTFGVIPTFARMNAAEPVGIPLRPDLVLDLDRLLGARGRVTYVCRPNNPTGTVFSRADVMQLAGHLTGVLLLDEAYADFADSDLTQWAAQSERVLSLRTFSKAFGLAGLRIGFAIGPAPLVREVEKSRGPYKVGNLAEALALAALRHDADWIRDCIGQVRENRDRLQQALAQLALQCWPSGGNFLLVGVPAGHTATGLAAGLRSRGVAVRPFAGLPILGDCLRVTVGPWPLLERFLEAMAQL